MFVWGQLGVVLVVDLLGLPSRGRVFPFYRGLKRRTQLYLFGHLIHSPPGNTHFVRGL